MPVSRRPVPELPSCPRVQSIAKDMRRSYPTGRQDFSRAFAGKPIELTISAGEAFPPNTKVRLVTTINAKPAGDWIEAPFERQDDKTFVCRITPEAPGLYSFWARFSVDGGTTWIHDPIPDAWVLVDPPQVDHMRLYTLIPGVSGMIADWTNDLTRIKEMGFNTVHLLPLTTLDTSKSPYSAKDLFSVEPKYLAKDSNLDGLAQLEQFVGKAKELGIHLVFDLVLNHIGVDSHMAKCAPEWIVPEPSSPDGLRRARFWSEKGWQSWHDLVLIDYEHPSQRIRADIWAYLTEYALFWAHYASETNGFIRFDNLHSSNKDFIDAVAKVLHREYPNVGIIAEYFTDASTLLTNVPRWCLSLILATPWDSRFVPQLRDYLKYLHSVSEHVRFFMPITSHDSGSPAQEFASVDATIPRYIAAALMGTGATGITQGVEWGIKERINFIGDQPRLVHTGPAKFGDFLKKVNDILVAEPAFRQSENCQFVDNNHEAVIAVLRKDLRPGKIGFLVVANFDILHEHAFEVDVSQFVGSNGSVQSVDLLTGQERTFPNGRVCLILPRCAAHVFKF